MSGAPSSRPRALRLAHRGDWRVAPENSVAAMRAALAIPHCDGLEFDVRGSRDGVPVVIHDETLDRVQRVHAVVAELTAGELADRGVPTLADVLRAAGPDAFLDVELKGEPIDGVIPVLETARGEGGRRGRAARLEGAVVSSFESQTLAWVGDRRPGWARWLNAEDLSDATLATARDLGCSGISAEWHAIDARSALRVAAAGISLAAWTVRRRPTAARLEGLGVAAICVEAAALDG